MARAGRKDEGTAELQKGRELSAADDRNQNVNLDIAEGREALDKGDLDQAVSKFQHAIKLQPESSDAQRYLGSRSGEAGQTPRARPPHTKRLWNSIRVMLTARQSLQKTLGQRAGT